MLELSNKCVLHLPPKKSSTSATSSTSTETLKLSEKEFAALEYVSGHIVHKIYLKLRKCRHWKDDHFQQCIQLLHSFKIEPTDKQKLVKGKDRGGLWYICESCVKIFDQAEVEFFRKTAVNVTKINYDIDDIFDEKLFCEKFVEKTC